MTVEQAKEILSGKSCWGPRKFTADDERKANFLMRVFLGVKNPPIDWYEVAVRLAYATFMRTLTGYAKIKHKTGQVNASKYLRDRLEDYFKSYTVTSQADFDKWHMETCGNLIDKFGTWGVSSELTYGQAQKWVNISFKYLYAFTLFGCCVKGFPVEIDVSKMEYCHLPLDNIVICSLSKTEIKELKKIDKKWKIGKKSWTYDGRSWSKLTESDYITIQEELRTVFHTTRPTQTMLQVDFDTWKTMPTIRITRKKRCPNN